MAQQVKSQPHSVRRRIGRHHARFLAGATVLSLVATRASSPPGPSPRPCSLLSWSMAPRSALTPFVPLEGDAPSSTVDSGGAPLGAIRMTAANYTPGATPAPAGQVLSAAAYPNASAAFGSAFGGDGSTTFGLPDLRGRTPIGVGTRSGGSTVALGEKVGSNRVTIDRAAMPVAYGRRRVDAGSPSTGPGPELPGPHVGSRRIEQLHCVRFARCRGPVRRHVGPGGVDAGGRSPPVDRPGTPVCSRCSARPTAATGRRPSRCRTYAVVRRSKPTATSTVAARSARGSVRSRWPSRRPTFPTCWAAVG